MTDTEVDWARIRDDKSEMIELQLVDPPKSRTTGAMVHDGDLYVPCDLGFVAQPAPAPAPRG